MTEAVIGHIHMTDERRKNITGIVKDYANRLRAFIRKRVSGEEDAEDILQEVFYQFAGQTEPIEQVGSWLFTVARNKITDSYRKHKLPLADDLFNPIAGNEEVFDWQEVLLSGSDNSETEFLRNLFWEEMYAALDELPAEQRSVFIANEIEDVPFREISEATGVTVATLISRKRYAVLHLRKRLKELRDELLNN